MKLFPALAAVLCALGPTVAPAGAADAPAKYSAEQILEAWGWMSGRDQNLVGIELNDGERAAFLQGASLQLAGGTAPQEMSAIFPDVEKLAETRREKITRALKEKNLAAAKLFFTGLEKNPGIVRSPSGLSYQIGAPGSGSTPKSQQTVTVHYTGRLIDGTEFVQFGPFDVVLVANRMSAALFEGVQKIAAGGRITLYVPPPLPAEEEVRLGIPTGSAAIYEVELLAVKETPPEDLANALLPPAPEPPPPPPSGFTELQKIETWGWITAQKTGAAAFQWSEDGRRAFLRGLAGAIMGERPAFDLATLQPAVAKFIADERERVRRATREKRHAEMETLFAALKKNPEVVELPDGLRYQILQKGTGPFPKTGQIVIVDYTGRLVDGTVFDRTDNEPLHIEVGSVVPGFNEGMQKINRGGSIKLYVPPSLGYGEENMSGVISAIPADSTLVYEIKLLDIQEPATEGSAPEAGKK